MNQVDNFLKVFDERTSRPGTPQFERALCLLLSDNKSRLPALETYADYCCFHKAFRQRDVTESGKLDAAIWLLLDQSELVWSALARVHKLDEDKEN
jgi:hypothetical protein